MKNITFIDEAKIKIKAGNGGDGKLAFHREKYVERGGPSGGNGGNGGSIYFKGTTNLNTLLNFKGRSIYRAENGQNGDIKNMTGKNGVDLFISVPIGTEIIINDEKIIDITYDNQLFIAIKGGKGGRGNASFKSSKNNAPTIYEKGEKTDFIEVVLNLKLLADVGLLGLPNAGKSTLISVISNAKPKIANYQFTTLKPQLGVVKYKNYSFVITDLPGLIAGASQNKGMGIEFLKHLTRTRLLLHLIASDQKDLIKNYQLIRKELSSYSKNLSTIPEIIVITKEDLLNNEEKKVIKNLFDNQKIFFISAIKHQGLDLLLREISEKLKEIKKIEQDEADLILEEKTKEFIYHKYEEPNLDFSIAKKDNSWIIDGKYPKYWANRIPLTTYENYLRIISKFKSKGIISKLKEAGLKKGDIITVKDTFFTIEYQEEF
ncbi:/ obg / Spo0B-associated GTP-binding protein /:292845 Forward [Candidatus Hepatoplasma crinochetorum]|uniref:GTPase Obg n=1 Tax=Candidatus Hepatoplasma crinochetorum TaxID=295596 RepID=A0A0G7ZMZ5_9MOLU|nr:/ obg / Spo0B-associated GTP-binding protein /:292845 Forward [Candidatus Hepatoplasma crinochetorum]